MKKFMIWLILAAVMITAAACGKEAVSETAQSDTAVSAQDFSSLSSEEQYALVKSSLPENDYEGYEFKFLTRAASIATRNIDLLAESINGEPINDAVFERNTYIEDKYNIKIVDFYGSGAESASDALKFILADDDSFDVVSDGLSNLATILITNDALIDIYTIEGLKLDERWWDYRLINSFDIKGQSYLLTGDISVCDDNFTMALLFNKQMVTDYSLDDIYKLIAGGSWTIDKMYDMAKTAAGDVNGDGVFNLKDDRFGLLSERYGTYGFWAAAGQRITSKNSEELLEFTLYNDYSVNVFNKAFTFQRDENTTWLNVVSGSNPYSELLGAFSSGRSLFYYGGLTNTMTLRSSDTEFGIITMPKYDENQKDYYNSVSVWNCLAFAVPITNQGANGSDRTGTVLESMAATSKYTLTPAYYEITLKGKLTRDDESETMLDLIMSTRVYDLGTIFDWGGSFSIFYNMTNSGKSDFASEYAAVEVNAQDQLDGFNKLFS